MLQGCHYRKDQPVKCKWTEVVGQLATDVQTMDVSNTLNQYITCMCHDKPSLIKVNIEVHSDVIVWLGTH